MNLDKTLEYLQSNPEAWDAIVNLMDDDIREEVHAELAPCTEAEFLRRYVELHEERFGEEFSFN